MDLVLPRSNAYTQVSELEEQGPAEESLNQTHIGLISAVQRKLSMSSFGSLFAAYRASLQQDLQDTFGDPDSSKPQPAQLDQSSFAVQSFATKLPARSRSGSTSAQQSRCRASSVSGGLSFSGLKEAVSNIAARGRARSASLTAVAYSPGAGLYASSQSDTIVLATRPVLAPLARLPGASGTHFGGAFNPLASESEYFIGYHGCSFPQESGNVCGCESTETCCLREYTADKLHDAAWREEIRKGKRPQFETLPDGRCKPATQNLRAAGQVPTSSGIVSRTSIRGDSGEWCGLGYALQVSKTDHVGVSVAKDAREGQYSKSREAWAVLHLGAEGEEEGEYKRWKAWHMQLELEQRGEGSVS
ncbi:hypothetical protein BV20DRAFT_975551 [Pilatotrama ljubarskyi]|nr:hypothetical protein BV20DRAFT_975551 [Pilatotrama ljubarskyi]